MKKIISILLAAIITVSLTIFAFASTPADACPGYGNVNGDTSVTIADARLILRNAIGLEKFTATQTAKADLDGDGVSVLDARLVLRIAMGVDKAPSHPVSVLTDTTPKNECDIVNSTSYAIVATMTDSKGTKTPMTIARKGNKMFMSSEMDFLGDGSAIVTLGILVIDGKLYMTTEDHKYSLEFTDKVAEAFEMTKEDIADMSNISNFQITVPDFSLASSVETSEVECPICGEKFETGKVYTIPYTDGTFVKVYTNGNKLLKIEYFSKTGKIDSIIEFTSITDNPSDSYFALPSNKLNRYPTLLQTPTTAMITFMSKVINVEDLL